MTRSRGPRAATIVPGNAAGPPAAGVRRTGPRDAGTPALTVTAVRRVLGVRGRWSGPVADLATGLILLSLLAALWDGAVAVALFALVLLGDVAVRLAPLRPPVQAVTALSLPAAAWAALADAYQRVPGLDLVAHCVVTGLLAVLAAAAVLRRGWLWTSRPGTVLLVAVLGLSLAVLWEFGEWVGHTLLDPAIQVGYDDTIGDLAAGALGAVLAGLLHDRLVVVRPSEVRPGHGDPGHGGPGQALSGPARSGPARSGPDRSRHDQPTTRGAPS